MDRVVLRRSIIEQIGSKQVGGEEARGAVAEHKINVNGLETSFLTAGEGPPLVLLHGSIDCGALSWYSLLPHLARNFYLIVPDCPGYGESAKPRAVYDAAFYIGWLNAFLETLTVGAVPLVGASQGGAIALNFALHYPQRVSHMALINPAGLIKQHAASVLRLVLRSFLHRLIPCTFFERWLEDYILHDRTCVDKRFVQVKRYEQIIAALPEVKKLGPLGRSLRITRALSVEQIRSIGHPMLLLCGESTAGTTQRGRTISKRRDGDCASCRPRIAS
jgi:pimeloyl-ACP methyl ester carboxylesterase